LLPITASRYDLASGFAAMLKTLSLSALFFIALGIMVAAYAALPIA
jgi:hypothetical protein